MSEKENNFLGFDVMSSAGSGKARFMFGCHEEISGEKPMMILFVSSENICRSPMAQAYVNHVGQGKGIFANSAGLYPKPNGNIEEVAVRALNDRGITPCPSNPFNKHTASSVTLEMIESSSIIVGMTESHALALIRNFPQAAQRIVSFPKDITEPAINSLKNLSQTLSEIIQGINCLFPSLNEDEK